MKLSGWALFSAQTGAGSGDLGRMAAVDKPGGQMPQQVPDPRADQPLEQLGDARPGAGEGAQRSKQRIEDFRTHRTTKWLTEGLRKLIP